MLVFRRPEAVKEPGHDPDPFLCLSVEQNRGLFLPVGCPYQRPVFIALGQSRNLIPSILKASSGPALEIVLEEWATQKEESPPLPPDAALPSVLTDEGDPGLGSEPIDVVFFLDSYDLLFHGETFAAEAPGKAVYQRLHLRSRSGNQTTAVPPRGQPQTKNRPARRSSRK